MPPLTITGVSATASRPISTLSRRTSKPLPRVRKLVPMSEKSAISHGQDHDQDSLRGLDARGSFERAGRRHRAGERPAPTSHFPSR